MNFLLAMLSEDGTGKTVSTMRAAVLLVILGVLAPRVVAAWQTGDVPALTAEEVSLVLGALGIKAWQRGKEAADEDGRLKMEDGNGRNPSSILHPPSSTAILIAMVAGLLLTGCTIGHHGLQWWWAPQPPSASVPASTVSTNPIPVSHENPEK